ncbi:hypothetical protein FEDK69T_05100 [Flavobacterium enshiense DK69]|nr:hypothetical protein FEDK69T_05100 [Flavobacterium enshiense DK69]
MVQKDQLSLSYYFIFNNGKIQNWSKKGNYYKVAFFDQFYLYL